MAETIGGRGVDPVHAELQRPVDRVDRLLVLLWSPAELPPPPPIAHAPNPTRVISRPVPPSCVVLSCTSCIASPLVLNQTPRHGARHKETIRLVSIYASRDAHRPPKLLTTRVGRPSAGRAHRGGGVGAGRRSGTPPGSRGATRAAGCYMIRGLRWFPACGHFARTSDCRSTTSTPNAALGARRAHPKDRPDQAQCGQLRATATCVPD